MATSIQRLQDSDFKNWLKGAIALIICKEGLENLILDEMTDTQQDILQNIYTSHGVPTQTTCTSCTTANVLPCPSPNFCSSGKKCFVHDKAVANKKPSQLCPKKICHKFSNAVRNLHRFNNPSWKNTDATLWCADAFHVAKCFLPADGYTKAASIQEIDFNGVISMILTNKRFQNKMAMNLSNRTSVCTEARDVGRSVRHSPDLSIQDADLVRYIDTLIDLLSDTKYLSSDAKANKAVDSLKKLKAGSFMITTEDLTQAFEESIKDLLSDSLESLHGRQSEAVQVIEKKESDTQEMIKEHRKEMNERKILLLQEIRNETKSVRNVSNECLDELVAAKTNIINEIRNLAERINDLLLISGREEQRKLTETGDHERRSLLTTAAEIKEEIKQLSCLKLTPDIGASDDTQTKRESDYIHQKAELREDLIEWYRHCLWTSPISPMVQENDAPLLEFYVNPALYCISKTHGHNWSDPQVRTKLNSYKDIFKTDPGRCSNIYVTADAGSGKTALVQMMALTWCQARAQRSNENEQTYFQANDIEAMKSFDFLFVVKLREENRNECDVDDMIVRQVKGSLSRAALYDTEFLVKILHEECCLILLDGLDEWTHPVTKSPTCHCESIQSNIPHKKARRNSTFLATTRRWKMSNIRESYMNIDKHIELALLEKEASEKLISIIIAKLNNRYGKNKTVADFEDKSKTAIYLDHIRYVPVMLIQLICLWFDGEAPGRTSCQVLSNMIELLMKRKNKNHTFSQNVEGEGITEIVSTSESSSETVDPNIVPNCFKENENCVNHFLLLKRLGNLAYDAYFGDDDSTPTVFEKKLVLKYVTNAELNYCFTLGILTQSKSNDKVSSNLTTISFQHKLFQDYFAALYIHAASINNVGILDRHTKECNSVKGFINEICPILLFLSGFSSIAASHILADVGRLLKEDSCKTRYRRSGITQNFTPQNIKVHQLMILQDRILGTTAISRKNGNTDVVSYIEDIFLIKGFYRDDLDNECLRDIINLNREHIKSLCIIDYDEPEEITSVIKRFGVGNLPSLQMLNLFGNIREADIYLLLSESIQSIENFQFNGGESLNTDEIAHRNTPFCDKRLHVFQYIKHLVVLSLVNVSMHHEQTGHLLNVISLKTDLEHVAFSNVKCKEHNGYDCGDTTLDLSKHCKLKVLNLGFVPVQELKLDVSCLEECEISKLSGRDVMKSFFDCIRKAGNLHTLCCHQMKTTSYVQFMINAVQELKQLQELVVQHCDIGDEELTLPETFEFVFMYRTSITGDSFRRLVKTLESFPKSVEVHLWECKVLPEEDFNAVKSYIHDSERWMVLLDGSNAWHGKEFRFQSKK